MSSFSWGKLSQRAFRSAGRQTQLRDSSSYRKEAAHTTHPRHYFFSFLLFSSFIIEKSIAGCCLSEFPVLYLFLSKPICTLLSHVSLLLSAGHYDHFHFFFFATVWKAFAHPQAGFRVPSCYLAGSVKINRLIHQNSPLEAIIKIFHLSSIFRLYVCKNNAFYGGQTHHLILHTIWITTFNVKYILAHYKLL